MAVVERKRRGVDRREVRDGQRLSWWIGDAVSCVICHES